MEKRKRNIRVKFYVTQDERDLIEQKMAQLGTTNMAAYLRKMAIDGMIVNLEIPVLDEILRLMRRSSANLNQLAKRAYATGSVYATDVEDLRQTYDRLLKDTGSILRSLAELP